MLVIFIACAESNKTDNVMKVATMNKKLSGTYSKGPCECLISVA